MGEAAGKFIVFEGVDGSGKSTQAFLLSKYLGEQKTRVVATREPGGTAVGERIREILLEPQGEVFSPKCQLLLYMASRAQHVAEVLKPSLERGDVVVCERFLWSSVAYQGFAGGLPVEDIESIASFAIGEVEPDLTIVLDLDPEVAAGREKGPGLAQQYDRIERKGVEFQRKVREGFLEIAKRQPERVRVLDASRGAKEIHADVVRLVADVL